jgi:AcrR family transcriptional regulator
VVETCVAGLRRSLLGPWTPAAAQGVHVAALAPSYRTVVSIEYMATRKDELTREAARLFAERGFHGTSMGDLAEALGVQKGSLYSLTGSKQELLFGTMKEGARAFHAVLDAVPEDAPAVERIRIALRGHLRVVSEQIDVATVFTREWRYLEGEHRDEILEERRRYEERWRGLFREGVDSGGLRTDLDSGAAVLLVLSAANWAYTWLTPGRDTDELAERFTAILVDGIRGYATRP